MNSFSLGKIRSHLEPGQRIWSQVSSSTGCHPKFQLWTTPSFTIFTIRVRIARQMVGWKTRNNNSSTTVSEHWRKRWTKCISVAGDYVEKWQNM